MARANMDLATFWRSLAGPLSIRTIAAAALLTLGCVVSLPSLAEAPAPWPIRTRERIALVNELDFRLRSAVLPSACSKQAPVLGAEFDAISNYAANDRTAIAQLLGLHEHPQAVAVAAGSPAAIAGLAVGDDVLSINGKEPAQLPAVGGLTLSDLVHDSIVEQLSSGPVKLLIKRGGTLKELVISPRLLCPGHANLSTARNVTSHEGGNEILVTAGMVDFTRSTDELALVMGHEFAHVFLGHDKAKSLGIRRQMERDADMLGAAIARCAGYDVAKSLSFWDRFGARDKFAFLKLPTHDKASTRKQRLLAYVHETQAQCPLAAL
ncbi:hypothetical protein C7W88_17380 (plasmid) [Novosphingobium sp. THN1]|nr:hypothetical protein C7W88_17380 [Novosphingobium sp. THN1]